MPHPPPTSAGPDPDRVVDLDGLVAELALLRARAAKGSPSARVSLAELARRVDRPRSTVHAYLSGKHLAPAAVLDAIMIALGASPAEQRGWAEAWFRVAAAVESERRARVPAGRGLEAPDPAPAPQQLPMDVTGFVGREDEITQLAELAEPGQADGAVTIVALTGTGGVGKTALAVHWAHEVAEDFPDGLLFVDLRGFDPDQPLDPGEALAGFLRALGVDDGTIPAATEERAALYRSLLDGQRVLVVLDNAQDAEQVRPLLPGTASCLVLVTSRDSLTGLVVRHGAHRIDVDVLPLADATTLLHVLVGSRVLDEGEDAVTVVEECARLPLAVRIAAELAASQPDTSLGEIAEELADERVRLDVLDADDDPRTAVRAVLSWSYQKLSAELAALFRLLGLSPGREIDAYAAAALAGVPIDVAGARLARLARAHLAHEVSPGRYAQHDLLRAFAAELAAADADEASRAALGRFFDFLLHTAAVSMDLLYPYDRERRPPRPPQPDVVRPLDDGDAARAWLDRERENLVAAAERMASGGWADQVARLAATIGRHLDLAARNSAVELQRSSSTETLHRHALQAALESGDLAAQATARGGLFSVAWNQKDLDAAHEHATAAHAIFDSLGDRIGATRMLNGLGLVSQARGELVTALELFEQARQSYADLGERLGEASSISYLGSTSTRLGDDHAAAGHFTEALQRFEEFGNQVGVAGMLYELGQIDLRIGSDRQAVERFERSLAVCEAIESARGAAAGLTGLGEAYRRTRRPAKARRCLERAVALYTDAAADPSGADEATGKQRRAAVAEDRTLEAAAHASLGKIAASRRDHAAAAAHWARALELYEALDADEVEAVRAQLAELPLSAAAPAR